MEGVLRLVFVCHGGLLRETIAAGFSSSDFNIVGSDQDLKSLSRSLAGEADVGIYVWHGGDDDWAQSEAERLNDLDVQSWVILCEDRQNPLLTALLHGDRKVCAAPLDISREDLSRLVKLSMSNHRLLVGGLCGAVAAPAHRPFTGKKLDDRQWRLMRFLSEGMSNKEIARIENCSEGNVKVWIRALLDRLGVSNRTQAAVLAARAGLYYRPEEKDYHGPDRRGRTRCMSRTSSHIFIKTGKEPGSHHSKLNSTSLASY
tara:strand:- start:919 stop:1695 length:777 start_codon:yes stop_codon:yes gene_type:complete